MKHRFVLMTSLMLAATILLWGCASVPATRFHSLLSAVDAKPDAVPADAALIIDLAPIGIAASADQPQWVVRMSDDTLRVLEQERWIAPLRDELRAALMNRLVQRWGAIDAKTQPSRPARWRVQVDVQRFESVLGKEAWLDSHWSAVEIASRAGRTIGCESRVRQPASGGTDALAAAHRRAVVQLADEIGGQLKMWNKEIETPTCFAAQKQ